MRTVASLLLVAGTVVAQQAVFIRDLASPLAQAPVETRAIIVGDFDVDGKRDVFIANQGNNQVFRAVGNVLVEVLTGPIVEDGGKSFDGDWGDMDGDGDRDLAVANARNEDNFIYRVDAADISQSVRIVGDIAASDGGDSYDVEWYDVESDGDFDLIFANRFQANFLYLNDGTGSFTKVTTGDFVTDVLPSRSMGGGDFDDDGDRDIFVTSSNDVDNAMYINQGGLQAGVEGVYVNTPAGDITSDGMDCFGNALGDVDKDGDLDLFVVTLDETQPNTLYRNDGNAIFTAVVADPASQGVAGSFGCALGDINADGWLDLYVANVDGANFLYRNTGSGTFEPVTYGEPVTEAGDTRAAVIADLDFDGKPDIVVADLASNNRVYRNLGLQWSIVGDGLFGDIAPQLASSATMVGGSSFQLGLTQGPVSQSTTLVIGLTLILTPFKGGVMGPAPDMLVTMSTNASGAWMLGSTFPAGFPVGTSLYFQGWMPHPSGPLGLLSSNTLKGITP